MHNAEILVPITLFAAVFGILYVYLNTRNKERMSMIEKGADPSLFAMKPRKGTGLKFGMLLAGVAIGIFAGALLDQYTTLKEEVAFFSMIFLFGGLSLIFHFLSRNDT